MFFDTLSLVYISLLYLNEIYSLPTVTLVGHTQSAPLLMKGIAQFNQEIGGINVTVLTIPTSSSSDLLSYYQSSLSQGNTSIDVLALDIIYVGDLQQYLVDVTNHGFTKSEINEHYSSLIAGNTFNGKVLAIPWWLDVGILFYRQDLLDKYNFPNPPKTWDELEIMAKTIVDGEQKVGQYGWVWQGAVSEGLTCNVLEWLVSNDAGYIVDVNGCTINNKEALFSIERAKKWIGTITQPNVTKLNTQATLNTFIAGNSVFLRAWTSYIFNVISSVPDNFDVGIASLPGSLPGTGVGTIGGFHLGISKFSLNKDAAARVIQYLTSTSVQNRLYLSSGYLPTRPTTSDKEICSNKYTKWTCSSTIRPVARPSSICTPKYGEVSSTVVNVINTYLSSNMSAKEALNNISSTIDIILNKNQLKTNNTSIVSSNSERPTWLIPTVIVLCIFIIIVIGASAAALWKATAHYRQVRKMLDERNIAETTAEAIATMDLESLSFLETIRHPTRIQAAFIMIIQNLKEYRSYLPSSVLQRPVDEEKHSVDQSIKKGVSDDQTVKSDSSSHKSKMRRKYKNPLQRSFENRKVTIMMCNISRFALYDDPKFHEFHKLYIQTILDTVESFYGIVEPFIGDRVMCSWNAVHPIGNHCARAVQSAMTAYHKVMEIINDQKLNMNIYIGLSTGPARVGTMGPPRMKRLGIIGQCVAEADIICRICQFYNRKVLIQGNIARDLKSIYLMSIFDRILFHKWGVAHELTLWEPHIDMDNIFSPKSNKEDEWMYTLQQSEDKNPYACYNSIMNKLLTERKLQNISDQQLATIPHDLRSRLIELNKDYNRNMPEFR
eukprot:NODE_312_length_2973_cov_36.370175_g270_i0.p1 GENE.NODE_312_length_2973_cov_36.370175_g270_i0~~NODE_312_length_2973_cov_36.370175_g270_i0.p1  ORF type:complete len:834 (-),score=121.98 NODE_312_length_2973_cov_36.370175_g270_i0:424-2925(-)